jgi:hypothetical protein
MRAGTNAVPLMFLVVATGGRQTSMARELTLWLGVYGLVQLNKVWMD